MMRAMRIPAMLLMALVLGACAVNPVTGKKEISLVSESQELAIGKKNYGPYRQAQGGDYVLEPELTRYVRSVGERIVRVSDRKLPYEFVVVNDSSPNAWALPGGKIALNRGLLVELRSEAELAAVIAHEIVHAAARHSAQSMERGIFLQGALVAAGVALGDSKYRDVGLLGAGIGAQLANQKYGRDDETEADLYGIRYLVRAGYDPAAAVQLQETFVRLAEGKASNWLEGLFASHPPSRERVVANRALVAQLGHPGGEVGEDRYQRAIARIRRNKSAYAAYDEAKKAFAKGDRPRALTKVNEAIRIEPKEAQFFSLRGEIKAAQDDYKEAIKDLDRAVALNPDYYRPLLLRGLTRQAAGDVAAASGDLERSATLLPTAEAYFGLGQVAQLAGRRDRAVDYFRQAATSSSEVGTRAGKQLARLDLAENPSRYIAATLGLGSDGYLLIRVHNQAPVAVRDVRVLLGVQVGAGIREQATFRVTRTLRPGNSVQLATRIGPLDVAAARRYKALVSDARVAD